ncbi:MAG: putative damage-inducible protein DinB [Planctomycetota bacterium]|jgi:uncharacterized damage-inducible protein DinB
MDPELLIAQLDKVQTFFERSTSALTEEDADFAPVDGVYTCAQLVGHVAQSVDWFMEGAFKAEAFSMDMDAHHQAILKVSCLEDARALIKCAFDDARACLREQSAESLMTPLPEGPVMGGAPRGAVISGIEEHTAHHRGALAVYARLRGHTPPLPYM